jgi:hypothetical protein
MGWYEKKIARMRQNSKKNGRKVAKVKRDEIKRKSNMDVDLTLELLERILSKQQTSLHRE